MTGLILIFLAMGLVTYIPRMLPLALLDTNRVPAFLQNVLKNVPFAVLGSLIFPAIFFIQSGNVYKMSADEFFFGLIGAATAFLTAYLRWNITWVVLSSIGVLIIYSLLT